MASCIILFLSDLDKDDNEPFKPLAVSSPKPAKMASEDTAGAAREASSDMLIEESDTRFQDAQESVTKSTFVTCGESDLDSSS